MNASANTGFPACRTHAPKSNAGGGIQRGATEEFVGWAAPLDEQRQVDQRNGVCRSRDNREQFRQKLGGSFLEELQFAETADVEA